MNIGPNPSNDAHHTVIIAEVRTMISSHTYLLASILFNTCFRVGQLVIVWHCWSAAFSIAATCRSMNSVSSLKRVLRNVALFITFDCVTFQLLHAFLYFCRVSDVYQQIGCVQLTWTLDFANIVWSCFHVVFSWSILWKANVLMITPHLFSWREELLTIRNPCS